MEEHTQRKAGAAWCKNKKKKEGRINIQSRVKHSRHAAATESDTHFILHLDQPTSMWVYEPTQINVYPATEINSRQPYYQLCTQTTSSIHRQCNQHPSIDKDVLNVENIQRSCVGEQRQTLQGDREASDPRFTDYLALRMHVILQHVEYV